MAWLMRLPHRTIMAVTGLGMLLAVILFIRLRSFEAIMMREGGVGIVGFELAFTPQRATEIVSAWGAGGQTAARSSLLLDYAFMPAYALAFSGITLLIARVQTSALRSVGLALAIGCFVAALMDALENLMLLAILNTGAAQALPPVIAGIAASIKFLLLVLAILYWLVNGIARGVRRAG